MRRSILALAAAAATLVPAGSAAARTLVVDDDAACAGARHATIQSAVDAAADGDTIRVCDGVYPEHVVVETGKDGLKILSVRLQGATVVPPADAEDSQALFSLAARGTVLRGFSLSGPPGGPEPGTTCAFSGVSFVASPGSAVIDQNRIDGRGCAMDIGIDLDAVDVGRVTVSRNFITGFARNAIRGFAVQGAITSNHVVGPGAGDEFQHGIFVEWGQFELKGNTIEDVGGAGIFLDGFERESFFALVSGNVLRRNLDGIRAYLIGSGIGGELERTTRIERNFAFDNRRYGIVDESVEVLVRFNRALGNGVYDCYQPFGGAGWGSNVGETDNPATLCREP